MGEKLPTSTHISRSWALFPKPLFYVENFQGGYFWPKYFTNVYPIESMYGIFIPIYIYHKNQPNAGKYTIHGWYMGIDVYFPEICRGSPENSSATLMRWGIIDHQVLCHKIWTLNPPKKQDLLKFILSDCPADPSFSFKDIAFFFRNNGEFIETATSCLTQESTKAQRLKSPFLS